MIGNILEGSWRSSKLTSGPHNGMAPLYAPSLKVDFVSPKRLNLNYRMEQDLDHWHRKGYLVTDGWNCVTLCKSNCNFCPFVLGTVHSTSLPQDAWWRHVCAPENHSSDSLLTEMNRPKGMIWELYQATRFWPLFIFHTLSFQKYRQCLQKLFTRYCLLYTSPSPRD